MRQRLDYPDLSHPRILEGLKYAVFSATLAADNYVVTASHPPFMVIDPDGAKDVLLPAEADSEGLHFIIYNAASGAENITVKDDGDSSTIVTIGQGNFGIVFCDGTTWRGAVFDQTVAGALSTLSVTGAASVGTLVDGSPQSLSGAGAVDVTSLVTFLTTTGADALTLADGTAGQFKVIVMVVDGGDGTLTPTNLGNGSTLTFDDAGDYAVLVFDGANWWIISSTATLA